LTRGKRFEAYEPASDDESVDGEAFIEKVERAFERLDKKDTALRVKDFSRKRKGETIVIYAEDVIDEMQTAAAKKRLDDQLIDEIEKDPSLITKKRELKEFNKQAEAERRMKAENLRAKIKEYKEDSEEEKKKFAKASTSKAKVVKSSDTQPVQSQATE